MPLSNKRWDEVEGVSEEYLEAQTEEFEQMPEELRK
jgi:hypothetical protein